MDKIHYNKMLVDQEASVQEAQHALELGEVSLKTAYANLQAARRGNQDQAILANHMEKVDQLKAVHGIKRAQEAQVKNDMEDAFIASSLDRNMNNTPSYGKS